MFRKVKYQHLKPRGISADLVELGILGFLVILLQIL